MLRITRQIFSLFERDEQWRLTGIVLAIVVSGLLQTVGIASVMPFLAVVSNPTIVTENRYLSWAYDTMGARDVDQFLFALGLVFIGVMVASRAFGTFTSWATARFEWRSHERISCRLMERYLGAPYSFHIERNSAELGSNLLSDVTRVIAGVLRPGTALFSRVISSAFIIVLLVLVNPRLAVLVFVTITGFYALIYALVRKKQRKLGKEERAARIERYRISDEAFGGIKDIMVMGREGHFLSRFRESSRRYARVQSKNAVVDLLPRFALETLAYGGIVAVILYLLHTRDSLDEIFPLLAVYALGANRLMPAVQEIFSSLTQIQFGTSALDSLSAGLRGPLGLSWGAGPEARADGTGPAQDQDRLTPQKDIRFRNVTFFYPQTKVSALDELSLKIPVNRTVGLVGETGSGKTTLVDLLLGLFEPSEGEITVDGVKLDASRLPAWRRNVGYVPQGIFLSDATIASNIAFGIPEELIDEDAILRASRAAHLDDFVSALPDAYGTRVGERGLRLSGGQRQRIGIARALYHDPDVLVMDEATSALDNVTEDVVMEAIKDLAERRTIILIAHRLTTVQGCDIIYLLEHGRVAAEGTYTELVSSSPTFRAMARA